MVKQMALVVFALFAGVFASEVKAQQPLQSDLSNPAQYVPFQDYIDAATGQTFYYDNQQNQFFVRLGSPQVAVNLIDQLACQAKANWLALSNFLTHGNTVVGAFEGIGYGSSPACNTCVPSYGMTLTGDAAAQSASGMWFRVRSWR